MIVRVISARAPYRRGGVAFETTSERTADGRAVVDLDAAAMRRIGTDGFRELLTDPNIEVQFPAEPGWRGKRPVSRLTTGEGQAPSPPRSQAAGAPAPRRRTAKLAKSG